MRHFILTPFRNFTVLHFAFTKDEIPFHLAIYLEESPGEDICSGREASVSWAESFRRKIRANFKGFLVFLNHLSPDIRPPGIIKASLRRFVEQSNLGSDVLSPLSLWRKRFYHYF